jgi:hypothetical protein
MAGGKGGGSKNIPAEITEIGQQFSLTSKAIQDICYASRMAAKVDNAAVQDGYNLYHHVIIVSVGGHWSIIQQGMNTASKNARRYHWISDQMVNFVREPHASVIGTKGDTLNLTAYESRTVQETSVDLVNDGPHHLIHDWSLLALPSSQTTLDGRQCVRNPHLKMPRTINWKVLQSIYDIQPKNFEEVLAVRGVGPTTIRALAYIAELLYGAQSSWKDPTKFSFAVGGKDGVPYPVDRHAMDKATEIIKTGILEARLGNHHRLEAIQRLKNLVPS